MPEDTKYVLKSPATATVDDVTLERRGEPKALSEDQAKRLRAVPGVNLSKWDGKKEGGDS